MFVNFLCQYLSKYHWFLISFHGLSSLNLGLFYDGEFNSEIRVGIITAEKQKKTAWEKLIKQIIKGVKRYIRNTMGGNDAWSKIQNN